MRAGHHWVFLWRQICQPMVSSWGGERVGLSVTGGLVLTSRCFSGGLVLGSSSQHCWHRFTLYGHHQGLHALQFKPPGEACS